MGFTCHEHCLNSASKETSWPLQGLFLGTAYSVKTGENQLPRRNVYWGQGQLPLKSEPVIIFLSFGVCPWMLHLFCFSPTNSCNLRAEKAHWGPERWNDLPKVTEHGSGWAKTNTQHYPQKLENTTALDYSPPSPPKSVSLTQKVLTRGLSRK